MASSTPETAGSAPALTRRRAAAAESASAARADLSTPRPGRVTRPDGRSPSVIDDPPPLLVRFAKKLRQRRREHRITLAQLGAAANVSLSLVHTRPRSSPAPPTSICTTRRHWPAHT
ncbi:hypothetical protein ABZS66_12245 [Dactylosporangium sp. NPDC005572]|uniref:hypothetical protein n=1 Tax=Dactylosporangium sp. NPDC005572 TaxID=3156889 RepID=UPI0033A79676